MLSPTKGVRVHLSEMAAAPPPPPTFLNRKIRFAPDEHDLIFPGKSFENNAGFAALLFIPFF